MNRNFDDFDKKFQRTERFIFVVWIAYAVFGCGITGFGVWVVIKLLQYFGVI